MGQLFVISAPSGAGKTTLLRLLYAAEKPSAGEVWVAGERMSALGESARSLLRNRTLGFVYQFHHLLPEFNALENTLMPALIMGMSTQEACDRAEAILTRVGLKDRLRHHVGELSGGEQQMTGIARALVIPATPLLAAV